MAGTGTTGPGRIARAGRAVCASMSQLAVFSACQMPFKSGLPSAVRGITGAGAWPDTGRAVTASAAPAAAATRAVIQSLTVS